MRLQGKLNEVLQEHKRHLDSVQAQHAKSVQELKQEMATQIAKLQDQLARKESERQQQLALGMLTSVSISSYFINGCHAWLFCSASRTKKPTRKARLLHQ